MPRRRSRSAAQILNIGYQTLVDWTLGCWTDRRIVLGAYSWNRDEKLFSQCVPVVHLVAVMNCPFCEMAYVPGIPSNDRAHREYCDRVRNGTLAQGLPPNSVIWKKGGLSVVLVTDSSSLRLKDIAHKTSSAANRETGFDGGLYRSYDPPDERQIHLFLFLRGNRSVGLLILERRSRIWKCNWKRECVEWPSKSPMWSIGFVWALRAWRRRGICRRLFAVARQHLGLSMDTVGWHTPFSPDGESFARSLYPEVFYVAK